MTASGHDLPIDTCPWLVRSAAFNGHAEAGSEGQSLSIPGPAPVRGRGTGIFQLRQLIHVTRGKEEVSQPKRRYLECKTSSHPRQRFCHVGPDSAQPFATTVVAVLPGATLKGLPRREMCK
jgi:hypothetical protein